LKSTRKENELREAGSRYAYDGLDRVIHERARLSLMTSLATHPKGLTFGELKTFCRLTDGNLNRHLQVLLESKFVVISKISDQNRRQTYCRITSQGRRKYVEYLTVLEQVLRDAKSRDHIAPVGSKDPRVTEGGS
jgi:DNA-binding MarR family transcriptional regulator